MSLIHCITRFLLAPVFLAGWIAGAQAIPLDTDGDGVEDLVDAFPNDACATTDTDHDGVPDRLLSCAPVLKAADSFETGNFSALAWSNNNGNNNNWTVQSTTHQDGSFAARSGGFIATGTSLLTLTYNATTPAQISFWNYAHPYLSGIDSLRFSIDGIQQTTEFKIDTWTQTIRAVSAGPHTYTWKYTRTVGNLNPEYFLLDNVRITVPSSLVADNCPTVSNTNQLDGDHDGYGNACDIDNDYDGIIDAVDNCPLVANGNQKDTDQDGVGNACDATPSGVDTDGDGVYDLNDNCITVVNVNQSNADADQAGDACDAYPSDATRYLAGQYPLSGGFSGASVNEFMGAQ